MDAPLPDSLEAAVKWLLGGVLIFAFGFESVVMLWEGKFLFSFCSLVIASALTLLLVYWSQLPTIILVAAAVAALAAIPIVVWGTFQFITGRQLSICGKLPWLRSKAPSRPSLNYLHQRDSDLGSAIIYMARRSAWGRWFAAQHLVGSGSAIEMLYLLQIAGSVIRDKILDGDLEVRGRRPGRSDYEVIPRTDWQSSALHFVNNPISLWKMVIFPTGGAEIAPDGTIARASDAAAAARTSQLTGYDSFLIDAYQFEKLWPKKDVVADKARRKLLRKAWWRGLDKDERKRLS